MISEPVWENYRQWLLKTHEESHAKSIFLYSKRYADVLKNPSSASRLLMLTKDMRRVVMSSLSNLSKFLGVYDQWKQIIANHALKWENTNNLETFLSILNTDFEETEAWFRKVIKVLPIDYATVLIFDYLTGLRPSEAALSCKLITELSEKNKLDQYLDKDLMMLQHFKFPSLFLRKSKKRIHFFHNARAT
jgi:hypothetical protein